MMCIFIFAIVLRLRDSQTNLILLARKESVQKFPLGIRPFLPATASTAFNAGILMTKCASIFLIYYSITLSSPCQQ